jgi:hypothetical protein
VSPWFQGWTPLVWGIACLHATGGILAGPGPDYLLIEYPYTRTFPFSLLLVVNRLYLLTSISKVRYHPIHMNTVISSQDGIMARWHDGRWHPMRYLSHQRALSVWFWALCTGGAGGAVQQLHHQDGVKPIRLKLTYHPVEPNIPSI